MAANGPLTGKLEDLYRGRYRYFLRLATVIVGDETSGHDAVQDGFAQALREQQSFRGEGPLEAWVWRTVVNAALASRPRRVAPREAPEARGTASANVGAGGPGASVPMLRAMRTRRGKRSNRRSERGWPPCRNGNGWSCPCATTQT